MHTNNLLAAPSDPSFWQQALYAFLAEKHRRSGSMRTVTAYSRTLDQFFGRTGKTPDQVVGADVLSFAHGRGLSGREPSSVTIGARVACISSFYRFLIRHQLATANPCDAVERPRATPAPPRGYSAVDIRSILEKIPDTNAGRRDRAIILTLVLTGRRKSEVLNLTAGDLAVDGEVAFYTYRGKGGKTGRRELPLPAYRAILASVADRGVTPADLDHDDQLWTVAPATFYNRWRRYQADAGFRPAGIHILRHTAAKLRRDAGESVESVSQFLDHSSLAVTTTYLRRLEGVADRTWGRVAEALGV